MNEIEIYKKFAQIYINGSACCDCPFENYATCESRYEECAKRIKEVIENERNRQIV